MRYDGLTRGDVARCVMAVLGLLVLIQPLRAQLVDGTVANVGTRAILRSDIEMELLRMRMQGAQAPGVDGCTILENLILHNMLLDQADLDSVQTNEMALDQEVEQRVGYFIMQTGSEEELERQYGRSLREIRRELRTLIGEQQRADQVRSKLVSHVKVTPSQVQNFYRSQPIDSLPMVPERFVMRQLTLNPVSNSDAEYLVKEKLLGLRERILKGERFSTLAMAYSEDRSSATRGGEMDYLARENFLKPFADAAFALQKDQVSPIVQTEYGYHIIQLIDKKGNMIKVRHILLKPNYSSDIINATIRRADSIRTLVQLDTLTFAKACERYSDDKDSRMNGGLVSDARRGGTQLDKETMLPVDYYAVKNLKPGEMTEPYESRDKNGNAVVKVVLLERVIEPHRMNLEDDYHDLQQLAKQHQEKEVYAEWVKKKQANIYIRISPLYKDCQFKMPYWKGRIVADE